MSDESQRGQSLTLFAVFLTVLLLGAGLVVDGGLAFYNRRQGQNAADLAALAGTHVVVDHYTKGGRSGGEVHDAITESVQANGCLPAGDTPCTWTADYVRPSATGGKVSLGAVENGGSIPALTQGVNVNIHRMPRTFFLPVVGQSTWDVSTEAIAYAARSAGLPPGQVLPIAVDPPNNNFIPNGVYELTAGKDAPGNFSWLSWNGSNSSGVLANSLCNPDNPALSFPVWIDGDPGKSNDSDVRECVDKWINNKSVVLLPMWAQVQDTGNNTEFHIVGLGAFVLLGKGQPAIDTIRGRFVQYYPLPSIGPNATWGAPPCAPGSAGCFDQTVFVGLAG